MFASVARSSGGALPMRKWAGHYHIQAGKDLALKPDKWLVQVALSRFCFLHVIHTRYSSPPHMLI